MYLPFDIPFIYLFIGSIGLFCISPVAQSVERLAVNEDVRSSSLLGGAKIYEYNNFLRRDAKNCFRATQKK
ncbi:hypothetical protein CANDROIZ_600003 [Candidatus Roizmanbacteria bacterium]|nr:hypothetical protein CANDROIZ_600003 [Candidatus Roizmanbacteria bacterium]